ncbi:hypothetical protein [Granulicella arctica]|uniref:hypothetical protein n=1 Tax=Granulicella arctica TaxID=940613 RepID=UPI0021DF5529|nr:hypothetical protein [Granulicella arctica]
MSGQQTTQTSTSTTVADADEHLTAATGPVDVIQGNEEYQPPVYATALDGSGLISMRDSQHVRLFYGATVAGGWDSAPSGQAGDTPLAFYTVSPSVGLQINRARLQTVIQYQRTMTGYSSSSYTNQAVNVASVKLVGTESERLQWGFKMSESSGNDATRFLAPQQTVAVGGVSAVDPGSSLYLQNAGNTTYLDAGADVRYRTSERGALVAQIDSVYSRYSGLQQTNGLTSAIFSYERTVRPALTIDGYGQVSRYYGNISCSSFGIGMGLKWERNQRESLTLSGGPQLNTTACEKQQGVNFSANFSMALTGRSHMYVLASRQPATSYIGPGLWQTSVAAGYQRQIGNRGSLNVDLGRLDSEASALTSSYRGTYVACVYNRQLRSELNASLSYRGYLGEGDGANVQRNVVLLSLSWSPTTGHIFR